MFIPRIQDLPAIAWRHCPSYDAVQEVVKKVAIECLKDLAASLALGAVVALFVPTSLEIATLGCVIGVQFAASLVFHSVGAVASYQAKQGGPHRTKLECVASVCEWLSGANFAILTGINTQLLLHEMGHSLAALALYQNVLPQMIIHPFPFMGGLTLIHKTTLNAFGKTIGRAAATILYVGSGPGLTLLISAALLTAGVAMRETFPKLSKYFIAWGICDFVNHADYAISALWTDRTTLMHDFFHLSTFGLHPIDAAVGVLAIPILIIAGMYWWQKKSPPIAC